MSTQNLEHTPLIHNNCDRPYCPICDGGLYQCKICGGAEGSLPSDCPSRYLSDWEFEAIYSQSLDFKDGRWVYYNVKSESE